MVTKSSINNLLSLKYKIQSLDWVHSVITLLDIPLLNNSEAPLQERLESFKTLKDEDVDRLLEVKYHPGEKRKID